MKNFYLFALALFCTIIPVIPFTAFAKPFSQGGEWLDKNGKFAGTLSPTPMNSRTDGH